jgi:hypothetical protein
MNVFMEKVRKSEIPHPTQQSFTFERWRREFESVTNPSIIDIRLYNSGVWIYKKLQKIRDKLKTISFGNIPQNHLIRYFCGYINRDAQILSQKKPPMLNEDTFIAEGAIQAETEENILQPHANIDETVTASIDGGRFPLIYAIHSYKGTPETKTSISDIEILNGIRVLMLLGQLYDGIETTWMDCLWHEKYIEEQDDSDLILDSNIELAKIRAVSEYRQQSLIMQFVGITVRMWQYEFPEETKIKVYSEKHAVKIDGSGKKKQYTIYPLDYKCESPPTSMVCRLFAQEMYLNKLINLEMPFYHNLSLEQLLTAWELLYSLAKELLRRFPEDSGVVKANKLMQYAPMLRKSDIIELISKSLKISSAQGASVLAVFTFKADPRNELWFQPFVEIDENKVLPFVSPMLWSNLSRNIDFWLKEGGIDVSTKGGFFERETITEFQTLMKAAKKLRNVRIHAVSEKDFGEQIDLVISLGNTLLIGEVKCTIYPSEPLEFHHYHEIMIGAVNQIKRKAEAVSQNLGKFLELIRLGDVIDLRKTRVIPFVFTNHPFYVGLSISDVPIVDRYILLRYFDSGQYERYVSFDKNGRKETGETIYFYKTEDEAEKNIAEYLINPPQIAFFNQYVKIKIYDTPPLDEADKKTIYIKLQVELPLHDLEKFPHPL